MSHRGQLVLGAISWLGQRCSGCPQGPLTFCPVSVVYLQVFLQNEGGMVSGDRVLIGGGQNSGRKEENRKPGAWAPST